MQSVQHISRTISASRASPTTVLLRSPLPSVQYYSSRKPRYSTYHRRCSHISPQRSRPHEHKHHPAFSTSHGRMSSSAAWSAGAEPSQLEPRLTHLLRPEGKWTLTADSQGVERVVRFKTFKAAWVRHFPTSQHFTLPQHHRTIHLTNLRVYRHS